MLTLFPLQDWASNERGIVMSIRNGKIKVLTKSDKELLMGLSRLGVCTPDQGYQYFKVNHDRLEGLQKSNFVKMEKMVVNGQLNQIVHLTKFGQNYMHRNSGVNTFPGWQTNHVLHDLRLTRSYCELPTNIQKNWKHENEILKEHKNIERGSCVDAIVTMRYREFLELAEKDDRFEILDSRAVNGLGLNDEISVAIESIGERYTFEKIEIKINTAMTTLGCVAVKTC